MEYGLIGERLGHSYSARIHEMIGGYAYALYPMPAEQMRELLTRRAFKGLNVTIPYKREVLPFCDALSEEVQAIGSANTLVVRQGVLTAYNTDLGGFLALAKRAGVEIHGRKVIILGSGGTSLTARAACARLGAREVVVVSRSGRVTYPDLYRDHADAQVLINTTPVGMYPDNLRAPVEIGRLGALEGVLDVVYNPDRTRLVLEALERGIPARGGLWMLVMQACLASQKFTGRAVEPERAAEIHRELRAQTLNLVLIGMPGSGKTSIGRALAAELGRRFVDCDEEIEHEAGMSIPEIFRTRGEAAFRDLEGEVIRRAGAQAGQVIATGGGAVLRRENALALRQNGAVIHLVRPVELLATEGRPLSTGVEALRRMHREREGAYAACRDAVVDNSGALQRAVAAAKEAFDRVAQR